ncbi:hypothetical protein P691DRAFT_758834 [Macrolepiota fuliginosa MF-IS2]|uniref:Uncharacterized protein n=1 Tax=Macrolepiota fuliginosa MF-IS2 TaxID=1400762 RepID=A0A9P6C5T3_9AGAR|nr:hypothetical protein P691DRAFT_758834 [Macrolepiota fuliginosa MF-IS2]
MDALNETLRPVATASLAGVSCMSILYGLVKCLFHHATKADQLVYSPGAHMVVFPACVYVLVGQRTPTQPVPWVILAAICSQFIITTMMLVAQQIMMFQSFVGLADRPEALLQIVSYWTNFSLTLYRISDACSIVNMLIGDAIMVWRVWIIFYRHAFFICLPPIITLAGSTACGIAMIHMTWVGSSVELIKTIAITAWALGIATQAYSTSLIAWEIWRRGIINTTSQGTISYYKAIVAMIVESGVVYTVLVLLLTITFATGLTSARIILAVLLEPIGSLIPAAIIICVGLNRNRKFQTTVLSKTQVANPNDTAASCIEEGEIMFAKNPDQTLEDGAI